MITAQTHTHTDVIGNKRILFAVQLMTRFDPW